VRVAFAFHVGQEVVLSTELPRCQSIRLGQRGSVLGRRFITVRPHHLAERYPFYPDPEPLYFLKFVGYGNQVYAPQSSLSSVSSVRNLLHAVLG